MKYLSLFSGYGGFELGIQQAYENQKQTDGQDNKNYFSSDMLCGSRSGIRSSNICVGFSEIDSYAIKVYEKHFPYEKCEKCRLADERQSETTPLGDSEGRSSEQSDPSSKRLTCNCKHKPYGDITKLDPTTLPDFDLLVGGFPCQAFSIAGKRAGFEDTRGTLIYDVFRIVKEKHPKLVLLENVKGLLSHDNGRTFKTIITSLAELGYAVEWQVLNAKNFGVPQNRERVFIIGHLGGFGGRQVFPIGGVCEKTDGIQSAANRKQERVQSDTESEDRNFSSIEDRGGDEGRLSVRQLNHPNHSNDRVYSDKGISPTLNTAQGGNRQPKIPVLTPDRLEKRQNGRRFKTDGEPMFTLNTQDKHGIYDGIKIRRLTPKECERLMGLPDGWTEGVSDTQRYKMAGNGVVINVVEAIVGRLIKNYE